MVYIDDVVCEVHRNSKLKFNNLPFGHCLSQSFIAYIEIIPLGTKMLLNKNLCLVVVVSLNIVIECFMRLQTDIGELFLIAHFCFTLFDRLNFGLFYFFISFEKRDYLGAYFLSIISEDDFVLNLKYMTEKGLIYCFTVVLDNTRLRIVRQEWL